MNKPYPKNLLLSYCCLLITTYCIGQNNANKPITFDTTKKTILTPFAVQQQDSIEQFVITTPVKPKNRFQLFLLGEHHQPIYINKYNFPVLDLATYKGGLSIVKKGGGKQTNSLRLATSDDKEYVMRSITKDLTRGIPYPFNKMALVTYLFKDMYLGSHPFAPLVVPTLADAAQVYHANPGIYYIPKQPGLGEYMDSFGDEVYVVEERASKEWPDLASFGNGEKFESTPDVAEKLVKNHKHIVDQNWVARSRLFDMLIGDFDRHDDQWRWMVEKQADDKKIYRPIPRDRDQAFSKYDGFVVNLLSPSNKLVRQLADYEKPVKDFKWATYNSRHFDQFFTNELSQEEWQKEAAYIQNHLTDEIIAAAFDQLPKKVYDASGPRIIAALKNKRANLSNIAIGMYKQLAKKVSVVGTNKKEFFEVIRQDEEHTQITVYGLKKSGEKKDTIYNRIFKTSETKQIFIYGMGDDDVFHISGKVDGGIDLKIVGGLGEDKFVDESIVKGRRKKDRFYDSKDGNQLELNSEGKDKTSNIELHNGYDRLGNQFEGNEFHPSLDFGYNADDDYLIGFSGKFTLNDFNKNPYSSFHKFRFNFATATRGLDFHYGVEFIEASKKWDIVVNTKLRNDRYTFNFFGLGNDSEQLNDDLNFYRVRQNLFYLDAGWQKRFIDNKGRFSIRPLLLTTTIQDTPGRFIAQDNNSLEPADLEKRWYTGLTSQFQYLKLDNPIAPRDGLKYQAQVTYHKSISASSRSFITYGGDVTYYKSIGKVHKTTFASKLGANFISGDYDFFFAPTLGQLENIRGMYSERFRGNRSVYHTTDVRQELGSSDNIILPMSFGVFGSFDHGRVWLDGEDSDSWHYSYGGGIWLSPLNLAILSFHYNRSDVDSRFMMKLGHAF